MSPPNHYGMIVFEGGGRIMMDITDVEPGEVDSGLPVRMVFRIKDVDEKRGFVRYFWKAAPDRAASEKSWNDECQQPHASTGRPDGGGIAPVYLAKT